MQTHKKLYEFDIEDPVRLHYECEALIPDDWRDVVYKQVTVNTNYTKYAHGDIDLSVDIGPVKLNFPLITACMDTVGGSEMALLTSAFGFCTTLFNKRGNEKSQLKELNKVMIGMPLMLEHPKSLKINSTLADLYDIPVDKLPVLDDEEKLIGFIDKSNFRHGQKDVPIREYMIPYDKISTLEYGVNFMEVLDYFDEHQGRYVCLVDNDHTFRGLYCRKDLDDINRGSRPAYFNGKPVVAIGISDREEDIECRVKPCIKAGASFILIDSSHANSESCLEQAKRVMDIIDNKAALIFGNVGEIDGYLRAAALGVDAVKFGIGGGSICTTSLVTGVGSAMFSLTRQLKFAKYWLESNGFFAPKLIADGGIEGSGIAVISLAAGADAVMAGKWMVGCNQSLGFKMGFKPENGGLVYYRGMASAAVKKSDKNDRYEVGKTAAEGIEGYVEYKGSMELWMYNDIQNVKSGFSHLGVKNIKEMHKHTAKYEETTFRFSKFYLTGDNQINTNVIPK